ADQVQAWAHPCKNGKAAIVAEQLRYYLRDARRPNPSAVPEVSIAADERTNVVFVSGPFAKVALAKALAPAVEVAVAKGVVLGTTVPPKRISGPPTLETYSVPNGNADLVAQKLQEHYKDAPQIRIAAVGPGSVMVYAAPDDQREIANLV